jgi:hypothetical protein
MHKSGDDRPFEKSTDTVEGTETTLEVEETVPQNTEKETAKEQLKNVQECLEALKAGDFEQLKTALTSAYKGTKGNPEQFKKFGEQLANALAGPPDTGITVAMKDGHGISLGKDHQSVVFEMSGDINWHTAKVEYSASAQSSDGRSPRDVLVALAEKPLVDKPKEVPLLEPLPEYEPRPGFHAGKFRRPEQHNPIEVDKPRDIEELIREIRGGKFGSPAEKVPVPTLEPPAPFDYLGSKLEPAVSNKPPEILAPPADKPYERPPLHPAFDDEVGKVRPPSDKAGEEKLFDRFQLYKYLGGRKFSPTSDDTGFPPFTHKPARFDDSYGGKFGPPAGGILPLLPPAEYVHFEIHNFKPVPEAPSQDLPVLQPVKSFSDLSSDSRFGARIEVPPPVLEPPIKPLELRVDKNKPVEAKKVPLPELIKRETARPSSAVEKPDAQADTRRQVRPDGKKIPDLRPSTATEVVIAGRRSTRR